MRAADEIVAALNERRILLASEPVVDTQTRAPSFYECLMRIRRPDDTRGFVRRVKDLGCRIAIDDFGAGDTSFLNLRKLGVDILKIDGAYVQDLMRSEDDRAFVRTLIDLSRRLGLKTVAEWVQDENAAQTLGAWGCDYLQGMLIRLASVDRPWGTAAPVDQRKAARP